MTKNYQEEMSISKRIFAKKNKIKAMLLFVANVN